MKNALKIGGSSLGHKKFRLLSTIALCLVAFTLFGFADTLGAYDKHTAAVESILDSHVQNASFTLKLKHTWDYGDEVNISYDYAAMNDEDIAYLKEKTGLDFIPVFTGSDSNWGNRLSFSGHMIDTDHIGSNSAYSGEFYGLTAVDKSKLDTLGFTVTGRMPTKKDEIAITEFVYRELNLTGFSNSAFEEEVKAGELTCDPLGGKDSIIGKHVTMRVGDTETTLKITGVIDTAFDYARYERYVPTAETKDNISESEMSIVDMVMFNEMSNTLSYGFHALGYVSQENIDALAQYMSRHGNASGIGTNMNWSLVVARPQMNDLSYEDYQYMSRVAKSSDISAVGNIEWLDGRTSGKLAENEILIHKDSFQSFVHISHNVGPAINEDFKTRYSGLGIDIFGLYGSESVYDAVQWLETLKYIDSPSFDFSQHRSLILSSYQNSDYPSKSDSPTDDELITYWKSSLMSASARDIRLDIDTLKPVYASIINNIYGLNVGDGYETSFYIDMLNYTLNGDTVVDPHTFQSCFAKMYAYELYEADNNVFKSQEFYDICVAPFKMGYDSYEQWINEYTLSRAVDLYATHIYDGNKNIFGDKTYNDFMDEATRHVYKLEGMDYNPFANAYIKITTWEDGNETVKSYKDYKVVGLFDGGTRELIVSDGIYNFYEQYSEEHGWAKETVAAHAPGIYSFVIAPMPTDTDVIEKLVDLTYEENVDLRFELQNQVMDTLYNFNGFIEIGAKVFLYIGIGFAVFAALMMMNFISTSISYKRREIGILRAVGARSSDVFKIFFCEATIIAIITYVLSLISTIIATVIVNMTLRGQGINVTLINFGIRQVLLMLLINIAVAAIASFFPVWNIARRNPIDAIKKK